MYQAPRGTQDILPADRPYWRYVTEEMHAVAALFGYHQMDTPIFEETSLFVRGVGEGTDIVDKEMYSFRDKGGAEITLRPEFTAGFMRAYIEHGMHVWPQPVKLYTIGPIFRYERPQAGRFRQHHQFNVEAVGELDPAVDFEVLSLAWTLLSRLGYRGLSFQLNSIGCPAPTCRPAYRGRWWPSFRRTRQSSTRLTAAVWRSTRCACSTRKRRRSSRCSTPRRTAATTFARSARTTSPRSVATWPRWGCRTP